MGKSTSVVANTVIGLLICISPCAAQSESWQTHMDSGMKDLKRAKYSEAKESFQLALKDAAAFEKTDDRIPQTLIHLADAYTGDHEYHEPSELYKKALAMREAVLGASSPGVEEVLVRLARLESRNRDYAESEKLYRQALENEEKAGKGGGISAAVLLEALATECRNESKFSESEALYKRSIANCEPILDSGMLVAEDYNGLSMVYRSTGDEKNANDCDSKAIRLWKESPAICADSNFDPINSAIVANNIGVTYLNEGRPTDAGIMFSQAIRMNPTYQLAYANRSISKEKLGDDTGAGLDRLTSEKLK